MLAALRAGEAQRLGEGGFEDADHPTAQPLLQIARVRPLRGIGAVYPADALATFHAVLSLGVRTRAVGRRDHPANGIDYGTTGSAARAEAHAPRLHNAAAVLASVDDEQFAGCRIAVVRVHDCYVSDAEVRCVPVVGDGVGGAASGQAVVDHEGAKVGLLRV
jgi:hypothetical protein